MKKILYILLFLLYASTFLKIPSLHCQSAESQYIEAIQLVKEGRYDFAFMVFRSIIRDFPESKYVPDAIFGTGEYLYTQEVYYEAFKNFAEYSLNYPASDGAIFAQAYLLKIMENIEEPTEEEKKVIDTIKMELFSKPLFLLFSEYKESSYISPFQHEFIIRYYIDTIEVYRDEEIFIKITP